MLVRAALLTTFTIYYLLLPLSLQAEEKIKIGFLLKTTQEDRYQHDKRFFEEQAKSLGAEVRFDSANNDSELQFKQFNDLLAEGCQVMVLQPVKTEQAEKMVRIAHLRGVRVVGYDALLTGGPLDMMVMQDSWQVGRQQGQALEKWLKGKYYDILLIGGPLDMMVMQDSWEVSREQGQVLEKWLQGIYKYDEVKGKIALIMGKSGDDKPDMDNNAKMMSKGICETVGKDNTQKCQKICKDDCEKTNSEGVGTKNPNLELVFAKEHKGWSDELAAETTQDILKKYPDIDAFICNNSRMARGVIRTLKAEAEGRLDPSKIFVAGSDADLANVRMVVNGEQNLEIYKKIKPLAETAAAIAVALALAKDPTTKADESFLKPFVKSAECPECFSKEVDNNYTKIPTVITPVVAITKDNGNIEIPIAEGIYTREQVYNK